MFLRFSSESKLYSLKVDGDDFVISWVVPVNLSEFNSMSLNGVHIGNSTTRKWQMNLSHISTNIVQSSVTNPNGVICTFGGLSKTIDKGNVL